LLGRLELLHLQVVALHLLMALVFCMLAVAGLEAVAVVADRLELAAEMAVVVVRLVLAARLAARVAMLVMVATALEIMVAQRLVRQVLAAEAVAAVVPDLILLKPVAAE